MPNSRGANGGSRPGANSATRTPRPCRTSTRTISRYRRMCARRAAVTRLPPPFRPGGRWKSPLLQGNCLHGPGGSKAFNLGAGSRTNLYPRAQSLPSAPAWTALADEARALHGSYAQAEEPSRSWGKRKRLPHPAPSSAPQYPTAGRIDRATHFARNTELCPLRMHVWLAHHRIGGRSVSLRWAHQGLCARCGNM